jgi:hypothetical protein
MPSTRPPHGRLSAERQRVLRALLREAVITGRTLDDIEAELDSRADIGEEEGAALWLYAWGEQRRVGGGGPPERAVGHLTLLQ